MCVSSVLSLPLCLCHSVYKNIEFLQYVYMIMFVKNTFFTVPEDKSFKGTSLPSHINLDKYGSHVC